MLIKKIVVMISRIDNKNKGEVRISFKWKQVEKEKKLNELWKCK